MDRYLGGQFPYTAFFWPALVAASAADTASSIAADFLEFSGDAGRRSAPRSRSTEPPLPTLQPDTVSLPPSAVPELNDCSWPIGARTVPTCDFSELTNILPISMSLAIVSAAWLIS